MPATKLKLKGNVLKLEVKSRNEETGEIEVVGFLNKSEVTYLLQFAINYLMAIGAEVDLKQQAQNAEGEDAMRIIMPEGMTLQ